jgi:integrase
LLDPAIEILKYYNNIYYNGEESYLFPILDESHDTPTKIDNRIHKLLRKTNKDLKIIGEKANIKGKLTTYVARHSFATILKYGGISTAIISEALGHESEKITQVYLDSFENNVLDEATKVIL